MTMKVAVNYSVEAAELVDSGQIEIDLFKCPAWPELVTGVQEKYPLYVHLPLRVGSGVGDAVNSETGRPPDWNKIESLLAQSSTPLINLHLAPLIEDFEDIPLESTEAVHVERITEYLIRDARAVTERFGPELVIAENIPGNEENELKASLLPGVISEVIKAVDCGFLFDLSHAQLAANYFGTDKYEYISELPVGRTREIHVNGIHRFEGHWIETARRAGFDDETIQHFAGELMDHLPMTEPDWSIFSWSMDQIESGEWRRPWVVTFEYGGVGRLFQAFTEKAALVEQVPRLFSMVKEISATTLP